LHYINLNLKKWGRTIIKINITKKMEPIFLKKGLDIFNRSLKVRFKGIRKYNGNAGQILKQGVNDCWNKDYFQASAGHFSCFYVRDFGISVQALLNLGYKDKVLKTLEFALDIYSRNNKITTTIDNGSVLDFPSYTPESLAYLMHSIRLADAKELLFKHRFFFAREIRKAFLNSFDVNTGLIKKNIYFSSMKDNALRISSVYTNSMIAMLSNDIDHFGLYNPFKSYNFKKIIRDNFWTGNYFLDDLSGLNYIAGDANVFPYWVGLFDSKKMINSSLNAIYNEDLDKPFPLKYTKERVGKYLFLNSILVPNYEGNAIWTNLGQCFIDVVKKVDKEKASGYIGQCIKNVEKYKNYLELYNKDGTPYKTLFYYSDVAMLWSSNLLDSIKY